MRRPWLYRAPALTPERMHAIIEREDRRPVALRHYLAENAARYERQRKAMLEASMPKATNEALAQAARDATARSMA